MVLSVFFLCALLLIVLNAIYPGAEHIPQLLTLLVFSDDTCTASLFTSVDMQNALNLDALSLASLGTFARVKGDKSPPWILAQERAGFHLGIATDLHETAIHAAMLTKEKYDEWRKQAPAENETEYKRRYFTIAVGGGNTLKAHYEALLELHAFDIKWIEDVRFFFLEESSGEKCWESPQQALIENFLRPLAHKLTTSKVAQALANSLDTDLLAESLIVENEDIINKMIELMISPIDMSEVTQALKQEKKKLAKELAEQESIRYQRDIKRKLGKSMAFHLILSGVSKTGGIGAFKPYTPELSEKRPRMVVLKQKNDAIRVALNRGVYTRAGCISLIISGKLKLMALGRFEMEDSADFEQTVMETPLRILREKVTIAEKVYIFANDKALHFDESTFLFKDNGISIETKAEVREGEEENGVHILLLHGFMGLYSYINFLIRLPSAWTVSALHRGRHAKKLPEAEIFPHYAKVLRKVILQNWRNGRPTPLGFHSMAGVISDHLLLSIVEGYDEPLPEYEQLKKEDQKLVDALRVGGVIQMACWVPSDTSHIQSTISSLLGHIRKKKALDYSGPGQIYTRDANGAITIEKNSSLLNINLPFLNIILKFPVTEVFVNAANLGLRQLLGKKSVQQKLSNREIPYALRIIGSRLLKKVSLFGLLKEVSAAMHEPYEYHLKHLKALEVILQYDIPHLTLIHHDDFMVSANRHREEHDWLLERRLEKEAVEDESELKIPVRFVLLERESKTLPSDPINPHLMVMSTSDEGDRISRRVTSEITRFVNENLAAAIARKEIKPLASVKAWLKQQKGLQKLKDLKSQKKDNQLQDGR
jgi:6-phosphogluconolactonase/glucosamine-6-phosphate isomerase/deaminase